MTTDRTKAPHIDDAQHLAVVIPQQRITSNGLQIHYLTSFDMNVVKVELEFEVGTKHQHKALLAAFTNELMFEGTDKYTSEQIAEKFEYYGAQPKTSISSDGSSISLICLKKDFQHLYPYFLEVIFNATYPEREVELHAKRKKQNYILNQKKVSYLAGIELNKALFKDTYYESKTTLQAYDNISAQELRNFHKQHYVNGGFQIFCSGNLTEQEVVFIETTSEPYYKTSKLPQLNNILSSTPTNVKLSEIKGTQSCIKYGKVIDVHYNSEDFFYVKLTNTLLGGFFGSRLMQNIREDKGYTYGISASFSVLQNSSYLSITTEVDNKYVDETLSEIDKELNRLQQEPVAQDELDLLCSYLKGNILKANDGVFLIMDNYKNLLRHGQPLAYFQHYFEFLTQVNTNKISAVATQYFQNNTFSKIVVS